MKIQLLLRGVLRTILLQPGAREGSFSCELDGHAVEIDAVVIAPGVVSLVMRSGQLAGRAFRCVFAQDAADGKSVKVGAETFLYQVHDPRSLNARKKRADAGEGTLLIKASMAGRVVRVLVDVGSSVETQAGVVVIEAMKMQNELRAPRAGRVAEIRVTTGEMVSAGQVLAVIE